MLYSFSGRIRNSLKIMLWKVLRGAYISTNQQDWHTQGLRIVLKLNFPPPIQCGIFSEYQRKVLMRRLLDVHITSQVKGCATEDGLELYCDTVPLDSWLRNDLFPLWNPLFETPHFASRCWVRYSLHAMAYFKQSHLDIHLAMWEDCAHVEEGWVSWNSKAVLL